MTEPTTILIDLRVAQINGDRGIPAYSQSLSLELAKGNPRHHWLLLYDQHRPLPARATELGQHARWCTLADLDTPALPPIDVLFTGCFFFLPHKGGATDSLVPPVLRHRRPRHMGIVYDLIPLLFADRYLRNDTARGRYFEALDVLRRCDHLFAISHATRQDTIRHAAVDPRRVHCIYGDIDHTKQELMARPFNETDGIPAAHGLTGPYCVYVGGDDWRKNLEAHVQAFAIFHRHHPDHQLALVCNLADGRIAELHRVATAAGLPDGAMVCTGRVSDHDLVGLVRHARMLVFASLYEGLGLPVLEAYGCGTPVVGSNTSSIAELVLPDLTCDPREPASIAAAMTRLVSQPSLREASLGLGRRLITDHLGWARAADKVMEQVTHRPKVVNRPVTPGHSGEPSAATRVALVTGSPAADSGFSATLRDAFVPPKWHLTLYHARQRPLSELTADPRAIPIEALPAALLRERHAVSLFVLERSLHDATIVDSIFRTRRTPARRLLGLATSWLETELQDHAAQDSLRILLDRGELEGLLVESEAARDRVLQAVGTLPDGITIAIGPPALPASTASGVTETGTAEACSRGAA